MEQLRSIAKIFTAPQGEDDVAFNHFLGKEKVQFFDPCLHNLVSFLDEPQLVNLKHNIKEEIKGEKVSEDSPKLR